MVDDLKQGGEENLHTIPAPKGPLAAREEETLAFWNDANIFERSLKKPAPKGEFTFYDGPPFATGLPHYGHLLQSALKDAIPRYKTMRGYHVARRWGWDCHGLPLENQIEQELGIKNKREIEQLGVEKFNLAARNAVLRYAEDWKKIIPRFGRWVDMENDYRTMDPSYTQSVWWAFKNLYDKSLVYESFKSMHYCPRCGTTLSNNEVGLGYKDIDDLAVYVKLPLVDEPNTSLVIWTTTPWTLPGNAAVAVKADATYVKVKVGNEYLIVAKELQGKVFENSPEVLEEFLGKSLIGKRYEPPFDYFKDELHKHKTHAWKVYAGDFVTLDSGTGLVHIAPAFGEDDLKLAQKEKIPLIHHVTDEGKFIATVKDFAHLPVKPKGNPRETDEKIAAWLEEKNLLFKKEKYHHAYPHCWRCDTPLLNWASNSWFVNIQKLKSQLVAQNKKVQWVPEHVGTGRFNNLLESAPDWAISRSRYWGAPIPVWKHSKTKAVRVAGSVGDVLAMVRKSGNKYFVMRHGQARSNVEERLESGADNENHLTEFGQEQASAAGKEIKTKGIELIVTSPVLRARETAAAVQKELGLPESAVMVDERLCETNVGVFDGKSIADWVAEFVTVSEQFMRAPEGGESLTDMRRRLGEFIFEIERRYSGKTILIVTHGDPSWILAEVAACTPYAELLSLKERETKAQRGYLGNGSWRELGFTPYPHNENYDLDLHRPYIDEVPMGDSINGRWEREAGVFDCWFESGSMPFASNAYPAHKSDFNPKRFFSLAPKGYPADFIAESIDQTRGWFYSLIVLGTALFGRAPYKAVVTNGLILAEDGRKMSKKLKNYPDPLELVERFGADALRYYLLSSAVIHGEDLRFKAQGVEEVSKKLLMRLDNVRSFYDLYAPQKLDGKSLGGDAPNLRSEFGDKDFLQQVSVGSSSNILDRWILARLNQLIEETTNGFEKYELDAATRPLNDFVDDLSTWYVRRSRERFKADADDKQQALATLQHVLKVTAQVMAPTMPFFADDLWRRLRSEDEEESVHLTNWPSASAADTQLIEDMKKVRALASLGLEAREKANIKLRQPLAKFATKSLPANSELVAILADELNIKEVIEDPSLEGEVMLDTTLTPELKEEGTMRNIVRSIQAWRKEQNLTIADRPTFTFVGTDEEKDIARKHRSQIVKETNLQELIIE